MSLYDKDPPRAINLLREYRDRLTSPEESELRNALNHLIQMFESNLFKALLDIQQFYEVTLLDATKNSHEKAQETVNYMEIMEKQTMLVNKMPRPTRPNRPTSQLPKTPSNGHPSLPVFNGAPNGHSPMPTIVQPPPVIPPRSEPPHLSSSSSSVASTPVSVNTTSADLEQETLVLRRPFGVSGGFGFSIAGGVDMPHMNPQDPRIYVTRINPEGVAARDGRMRVNDIIISVNGVNLMNVTHAHAVDQLKRSGDTLILEVKHTTPAAVMLGDDGRSSILVFTSSSTVTREEVVQPPSSVPPPSVRYQPSPLQSPPPQPSVSTKVPPPLLPKPTLRPPPQTVSPFQMFQADTRPVPPPQQTQHKGRSPPPPPLKLIPEPKVIQPAPEPKVIPPAPEPKVILPPAPEPKVILPPAPEPKVILPPAPEPKVILPPAPEPKVILPPAPEPKVIPPAPVPKVTPVSLVAPLKPRSPSTTSSDDDDFSSVSGTTSGSDTESSSEEDERVEVKLAPVPVNGKVATKPVTSPGVTSPVTLGTTIQIELVKPSNGGLGFSIAGGVGNEHVPGDCGIFVTGVIEGGAAHRQGQMRAGDRLLSVNEKSLNKVTHPEAVSSLKNAGNRMRLVLLQPPDDQRAYFVNGYLPQDTDHGSNTSETSTSASSVEAVRPPPPPAVKKASIVAGVARTVVFQKTPASPGLGFNIVSGDQDRGIFVSLIYPGSIAANSGALRIGDQLVKVNGVDLSYVSQSVGAAHLKSAGDRVELVVVFRPDMEARLLSGQPPTPVPAPAPVVNPKSPPPSATKMIPSRSETALNVANIPDGYATQPRPGQAPPPTNYLQKKPGPANITKRMPGGGGVVSPPMRAAKSQGNLTDIVPTQATSTSQPNVRKPQATTRVLPTEFFVRTLYDYDAKEDSGLPTKGLSFRMWDVLHVVDALNDEWWRARLVYPYGGESRTNLIPSHWRRERRERARLKRVNFNQTHAMGGGAVSSPNLGMGWDMGAESPGMRRGRVGGGGPGSNTTTPNLTSLGRKLHKGAGAPPTTGNMADSTHLIGALAGSRSREGINELGLERIPTYEHVTREKADFTRPVVLMGAVKDSLHDTLVNDFPDNFKPCVPHTSRTAREGEVNGRDYFFTTREDMELDIKQGRFIEAGQYNGNLYGTSISAVRDVALSGRHCLLDVSGAALKRLCDAGLQPIAILIQPTTHEQLKDLLASVGKWPIPGIAPGEEANTLLLTMDKLAALKNDFGHLFTAILREDNSFETLFERVKHVIEEQTEKGIWTLSEEQLCFTASQSNMDS